MAKHKHRDQESTRNDTNASANTNNSTRSSIPFGIDPMQLMGLLGGNFDMNNMGNMLASMNTNGFNLGNLNSIAQMMGLNLDNNLFQNSMTNQNVDNNKIYPNMSQNPKKYSNNTNSKSAENSYVDRSSKKSENSGSSKSIKENDPNLEFLMALKNYVHPDRARLINKIIEAYKTGEFDES
ncbi:hypothetical protein [Clostridium saccharoperbutylacetonicum]|jgi:hypothetical protein